MSRELLEQLIELLEQSRVSELVYANGGTRMRLVKREEAAPASAAPLPPVSVRGNDDLR
ncbi:MAG TPA: hypothetical protein VFX20_11550 [Steroidobacteraceae bacterium]|nr:hypothetical protein [Steroidobacteraceae bacterium]